MKINLLSLLLVVFAIQAITAQNYKFGKVSKEELLQKTHSLDPSANAAILYREKNAIIELDDVEGFYLIIEVHERIKIYNKEGYRWATSSVNRFKKETVSGLTGYTFSLGEDGNIKKEKLTKDGIFDEKTTKYFHRTKFTFPNLTEGCVVEFKYKIKSPYFRLERFRLQEKIPIDKLNVSFHVIEQMVYKNHRTGWIPFKIEKDQITKIFGKYGTYRQDIYRVNMVNVPAAKEEAFVGNLDNYIASLKFELDYTKWRRQGVVRHSSTWPLVTKNINESPTYNTELKKEAYYKKEIDQLINDVSGQNEKMLRIFDFLKNKMTWNNFEGIYTDDGVRHAYKEGRGNIAEINLMLTSMLRYAGLNSNPVLLSTKDKGIPIYPTLNGFNYVISGVEINNEWLLLDASNKYGEVNILEPKLLNWRGRMIRPDDTSDWVSLTPVKQANKSSMISATIDEDFTVSGNSQIRYTGHFAQEIRDGYLSLNEEEIRQKIEEKIGDTEIAEVELSDVKELNKPISLKYSFKNRDAVEEIGGKLYITPMLFKAVKESPFKLEIRKYPVNYEYSRKNRDIININIPNGYKIESMPENTSFSLGDNLCSFLYRISNDGNVIRVSTDFSINNPFIDSSDYEKLKGFYQFLIQKQNEKVVLIKT